MNDQAYDYVVIGSGFGGSVSAMRLAQKGYRVLVIESGKRWTQDRFPNTNWMLNRFLWMPNLGFYGIQRMNLLNDVFILSGAGVGGGSLNYANTLYVPPESFFNKPSVKKLGGKDELIPYYTLAGKMLGVTLNPNLTDQDHLLKETAAEFGKEDTFRPTPVGVYFGSPKETAPDPYFLGEGPERTGCELCGGCMTGCKKDAKNTLDKNYLFFAEKFGAKILAEHKVFDILPLSLDGKDGYQVRTMNTTALFGKQKGLTIKTRGIVFSAGALGTLSLLLKLKQNGRLPKLSDSLGEKVRTNSETLIGVESRNRSADYSTGVAITSSIHVDHATHIEPVRYSRGNDAMSLLTAPLTDGEGPLPRPVKLLLNSINNPVDLVKTMNPIGWAKRSVILLVMQTHDNYINVTRERRMIWPFVKTLTSRQASDKKNPVYIPIAYDFSRRLARKMDGIPASMITEATMNIPITAHIMGGCPVGHESVIDDRNKVIGYPNLYIADGSQIPENLGVNPALSITAFSERAMSFIPPKAGKSIKYLKAEHSWGLTGCLNR